MTTLFVVDGVIPIKPIAYLRHEAGDLQASGRMLELCDFKLERRETLLRAINRRGVQ